ncbi:DUF4870 domain-containing protein [Jeongeupia chitinilytica]|uniref:DUF4870 domain-containing protein n=1 Tax=Jeongeupia chitinilytica TaxID=1041641 RepID=A0ABQ3H1L4_9NEIS|nr:DUF4870 domain-containing protein [Jeongeupia chitinilytica]GHD61798.1 hypothetical protein GCM10007350_16710 [Jeongeupia chitinilytica]
MLTLNPKPRGDDDDGKQRPPQPVEKGFAALAHLAGLFWIPYLPMPILALVIPFLILQFARVHSQFVEQHAVQAVNFQLLMGSLYLFAMVAGFALQSMFLIWWVAIGSTIFSMWEGAKAINGWQSKYPLTIKLFK